MSFPIVDAAAAWLSALDEDDAVAGQPTAVVWNLRGMEAWWRRHPDSMDFLAPASDNHALKSLETRLYREALGDALPQDVGPDQPALRILDAACGIGRFALPFAVGGHRVDGIDACLPSLEAAARHAGAASARHPSLRDRLSLIWADIAAVDALTDAVPEDAYDLVLGFELLCYLPDPATILERLARRLKPGGLFVGSVEAWPGALLSDPSGVDANNLGEVLRSRVLAERDERWVQACGRSDLGAILRLAGLQPSSIVGTHYIPDGPMGALLEHSQVGEADYDDTICALERQLREDMETSLPPRAWLMVAERPR